MFESSEDPPVAKVDWLANVCGLKLPVIDFHLPLTLLLPEQPCFKRVGGIKGLIVEVIEDICKSDAFTFDLLVRLLC